MTERHPPIPDPHLEAVAAWHPIEGTPTARVTAGCRVDATIGAGSSTGPRRSEGD